MSAAPPGAKPPQVRAQPTHHTGFSNDVVNRNVPEAHDELVIVPQYFHPKHKRFMFSLEYPWQLKGILPQAEYRRSIMAINNSILTSKQKTINLLCFFCGGCCAMCCAPDVYMVAKETVFEPHGLSLRGPRAKTVPKSTGYTIGGPTQEIQWLEIVPSVNMKPIQPMGSAHKAEERRRLRREQRGSVGSSSSMDSDDSLGTAGDSKRSGRHRSNSTDRAALPGALPSADNIGGEEEALDDDSAQRRDSQASGPAVPPIKLQFSARTHHVKYEKPKPMTEEDRRKNLLNAMPLSEKAREAIRLRLEHGVKPRAPAAKTELRPHPFSHKLVGGQGEVDRREIEEEQARQRKVIEDRHREERQRLRKAQLAARERSINLAVAAAAKAAEEALDQGRNPFAPGMGMGMAPYGSMHSVMAGGMVAGGFPGAAMQPTASFYGQQPAAYGMPPAAVPYGGPPPMSHGYGSSSALQMAGASAFGGARAHGGYTHMSGPASTQMTPRGYHGASRHNSTGSFRPNLPARNRGNWKEQAAMTRSPTASNLRKVASELERLASGSQFSGGTGGQNPHHAQSSGTSSRAHGGTRRGGGVGVSRAMPGVPNLNLGQSTDSLRGNGERAR